MDQGMAMSISSNTVREGILAFFFEQRGLMAGVRMQGTRIARRPS
jgi:lipid-binding SYLF domain-containing protein